MIDNNPRFPSLHARAEAVSACTLHLALGHNVEINLSSPWLCDDLSLVPSKLRSLLGIRVARCPSARVAIITQHFPEAWMDRLYRYTAHSTAITASQR
jgi:hypothetical protein